MFCFWEHSFVYLFVCVCDNSKSNEWIVMKFLWGWDLAKVEEMGTFLVRVRNLKFARNLKFTTSKTLVNFMKKMMFLSKNWYFTV